MYALKQYRAHNAFQFSLGFLNYVQILRSDYYLYRLVFVKSVIYAVKFSVLEHYHVVFEHNSVYYITFAYEIGYIFIDRLIINICRAAYLLYFAVFHNNYFIRHCKRFFLVMRYIYESYSDFLLNFFQLLLHFLSQLKV